VHLLPDSLGGIRDVVGFSLGTRIAAVRDDAYHARLRNEIAQ
jgi:hypothetical protein